MTASQPGAEGLPSETPGKHGIRDRARRGAEAAKAKYSGSSAEHLWSRLDSLDFINRGMLLAAILLLCFFPFLIVANALAGHSAVTGLVRRLGLNQEAAADVSHLFTSSSATSSAITGTAWVFFVLGGIAAAAAVQELYERAFALEHRGMRDMPPRLIWLAVLAGATALTAWAGPQLGSAAGPVLLGVVGLGAFTGFWWLTMWLLLSARVPWKELFPSAVATAICWIGMEVVFSFTFSSTVISNNHKYGPIGVVFALMSWLIAIGVVIILGAILGVVWRERELSFTGAFKKVRRRNRFSPQRGRS